MLTSIALLTSLVLSDAAGASATVKEISARLKPFSTLHATFVEERRVEGLTKPLKSTGRLVYARNKGLLWLVEKPLASQTVMTSTSLVQTIKGRVTVKLDVAAQPSMQVISRLFVASLTGDWAPLEADFEMNAHQTPSSWTLRLTPKGGLFAKFARSLEVTGDTSVHSVELAELSGDSSTTQFATPLFDVPLTADEEARLGAK